MLIGNPSIAYVGLLLLLTTLVPAREPLRSPPRILTAAPGVGSAFTAADDGSVSASQGAAQ